MLFILIVDKVSKKLFWINYITDLKIMVVVAIAFFQFFSYFKLIARWESKLESVIRLKLVWIRQF